MQLSNMILDIDQHIEINAPIEKVFEKMIHRLSDGCVTPDQTPMPLKLEAMPGGRWYRDLGNDSGHLWGHVQVIKPPTLLEIHGPLFMSYPVTSHLAVRFTEIADGTKVSLRHRALGMIEQDHREGVTAGWQAALDDLQKLCC